VDDLKGVESRECGVERKRRGRFNYETPVERPGLDGREKCEREKEES
jgi:hypothetical protein